ncbi:MAG: hypothetical protein PHG05_03755 [Candidatus Nanoarchaeia archaeon]|nr:hypothetical protein [Candidatus Nanoarchaeia archaeon]
MIKAFMGVSIRNPFYSKKENILRAIELAKDFDEFLIFVVDHPYRLSLQAFNGIPEKIAEKTSLEEGEELKKFLINISSNSAKIKICSWKELEAENYKRILTEVKNLENKDKKFSKLIEGEFTGTVISKVGNNLQKKELSKSFIMEELAMFISLIEGGYSIRISKYSQSKSVNYFIGKRNLSLKHIRL